MTIVKMPGSTLAWTFVAGVLLGIAVLFGFNGPHAAFAQADTTAPTISSIAITSDTGDDNSYRRRDALGVYSIGDSIQITVTFNEDVSVTGAPQLELAIGSSNRTAEYESTDGSAAVFSYTVAEGDSDPDGISVAANKLSLNGGSIKDAAGNDANLSHNALAAQDGHMVDGIRPTISAISIFSGGAGYDDVFNIGDEMFANISFSEAVRIGGEPQLTLDFDGEAKTAEWIGDLFFDFSYLIQEGDLDTDGVAIGANALSLNGGTIKDAAGNDAILTHDAVGAAPYIVVDGVRPTVSSIAITSDPGEDDTYGTGDKIEVTVTFSEKMIVPVVAGDCPDAPDYCMPQLELDIGGEARTAEYQNTKGAAVVFAYNVQAGDIDENGIAIRSNKLTLNGGRIEDAVGIGMGANLADVSHAAVAADTGHKVVGPSLPLTLSGITMTEHQENDDMSVATYWVSGSDAAITWSLSGDDSDDFSIDKNMWQNGVLRFTSPPNYENPTDADTDNLYRVTIQASDGTNVSTLQIVVLVRNVWLDADEVPVISGTVRVGETLTADTSRISVTFSLGPWYWWIRSDGTTDTEIEGATGASYTLTDADAGKTVKVRVNFYVKHSVNFGFVSLTSEATAMVAALGAEPNTPATGAPTINGTAQVGETLTVDISGIDDDDGLPAESEFDYQWIAGTTDISGATGSSYAPLVADLGKTIKVRVSFDDDQNNFETLTSAATGAVAASPYGAVIWSGTMTVGRLQVFGASLFGFDAPNAGTSLDFGDLEPFAFSYAGNSYIIETIAHFSDSGELEFGLDVPLVSGDFNLNLDGTPFLVRSDENTSLYAFSNHGLSWTNGQKVAVRLAVNRTATGVPVIGGTAQVGETLTVDTSGIDDPDGIGNATFSYQWIAGTTDISRAMGSSYAPLVADVGKAIKVRVSFTDGGKFQETLTSEATATVTAAVTPLTAGFQDAPDKHEGTGEGTGEFTFHIAFSEPISISYVTLRDGSLDVTNGSATKAKRVNGQSDLWQITVKPDSDADVTVVLPITEGCAAQDAVCTRDNKRLSNRLELTVPGPEGSGQNSPATGAPTITGTAQVDETLTAVTSGIEDVDGLANVSFSYQWLANDAEIAGATDPTYTLVDDDAGLTIKVKVSFFDDKNNPETPTSAATTAVLANVPDAPEHPNVSLHDTGALDVSWEAPSTDGGSAITEYRVQWKETAGNWDAPADVSEETATGTTHTITGLTDGVEYTVRIIAVNDVGDGPPSGEATGTPREATAPVLTKATVKSVHLGTQPEAAEANSGDEPVLVGSVTVVVTQDNSDPDNVITSFAVTWRDYKDCASEYNAYFATHLYGVPVIGGGPYLEGFQIHLGSAASADSEIAKSLSNVQDTSPGFGFEVKVYCGTFESESGRGVSFVYVPQGILHRPQPGTHSSEPGLTALTVNPGTLSPEFHNHTVEYTVGDVPNANDKITVTTTVKTGLTVGIIPWDARPIFWLCSPGAGGWRWSCSEPYEDEDILPDADVDAPGYQLALEEGDNHFAVFVWNADEDARLEFTTYILTVTRAAMTPLQTRSKESSRDTGVLNRGSRYLSLDVGTAEETASPDLTLIVAGTFLTLTYDEALDEDSVPATGAFTVAVSGTAAEVSHVSVSGSAVTLMLASAVTSEDTATVSYAAPTDAAAPRIEDDAGNPAASFSDQDVENNTPPSANAPATGAPTITGTAQVGDTLTVETSAIDDADGVDNVSYSYQWLANGAEIAGATDPTYTLVDADEGKAIEVKVSFRDDKNNQETLTSAATAAVDPDPGPMTGFTVVDASDQSVEGALADGGTLALDDPVGGSFGIRADLESGATIGSMRLQLTGAKTHNQTENITPYSLYGDSGGNLSGESLPVGEYTLTATAYSEARLGGNVLGTLKVSFSVTETATQQTNTPATGLPTISGTAQVGKTLTASASDIDDTDGMSGAVFSYQWLANEVNIETDIAGATDPTYTLVADDLGKAIKVKVSFRDDKNNPETLTSEPTATVVTPLTAEFRDAPDKHDGTGFFTFDIAFSEPISISYKTLRDDSLDVTNGSATKAKRVNDQSDLWEITVEPEDSNAAVTVVLPITEDCGAQGAVCSRAGGNERRPLSNRSELTVPGPAAANSPATGAPSINGTAQVGETLTVDTSGIDDADGMSGAVFSYQGLANDAEITGATSDTYTLVEADVDKAVKVRVIFNDDDDNEETLTSPATAAVAAETAVPDAPQSLNVSPDDTGTLDVSWEAPASDGGSAITGYKVQWKSGSEDYDGSAGSTRQAEITDPASRTHTITGLTDGVEYTVRVIAVNDVGDGPPSDEATATPRETTPPELATATVDGTTLTLTYDEDLDENSEPSSDAFSVAVGGTGRAVDGVSVSGSSVILTLGSAVAAEETVTVSYTVPTDAAAPRIQDDAGNPAASFSDQDVENNTPPSANTPATGAPTISGTAQVSETLTVDTSAIDDADGLDNVGYSYQWLANGADMAGATSSSYRLVEADNGKTIKVKVSFRDDKNNPETLTSEATAAVEPRPNSPATGAPTISGTAQVGETLTAETSAIADADGMSGAVFSYQWLADGVDVAGATSDTYTPVDDDVGKAIQVKVSFRDDMNHQESLTSAATASVTAAADDSSIWSATLTVGSSGSFHGYWKDLMGSLAPDGFNIDGSDYTVTSLNRYGDLMFAFVLDQALPGDFTLQVGDTTFRSEEAEVTTSSSSYSYQWQNKIPDLSDGDIVEVSLTVSSGD